MTNARCIANRLERKRTGMHRHVVLLNGKAKAAEVYPEELCKEIVKGLIEQMEVDGRIIKGGIGAVMPSEDK